MFGKKKKRILTTRNNTFSLGLSFPTPSKDREDRDEDQFTTFMTGDEFLEKRKKMNELTFKDLPLVVRKKLIYKLRESCEKFDTRVEAHFSNVDDLKEIDRYDSTVYHTIFNNLGWVARTSGSSHHGYWNIRLYPKEGEESD